MNQDFKMPQDVNDRKLSPKELRELKRNGAKARNRRKKVLCVCLAVVLLLIASIPAYRLVYQPYQAKSVYRYMKTLYTMPGSGSIPGSYNQQLGALYDVNSDIGGWLIVQGTQINLPVARTKTYDSVFYVNHLFDGTENPYGTPYFLAGPTEGQRGTNTVIRGGEQLFGELNGYRSLEFYRKAPVIFFDGLTDAIIYKIFAIVPVDDSVDDFTVGIYETPVQFREFVETMGKRSLIHTGITVAKEDSLLTLLCDTPQGKLAVVARAVRENEDYTVDTSMATMNSGAFMGVAEWTVTATDWVTPTNVVTATQISD